MWFFNLLDGTGDTGNNKGSGLYIYIIMAVMVLILVVGYMLSRRSNKKRREQQENMYANIAVGTEILTIGGIIGTVVSLDAEAGTYVIETGAGDNKSTMTINKLAIYSAKVQDNPVAAEATEEVKEEAAAEEVFVDMAEEAEAEGKEEANDEAKQEKE